MVIKTAKILVIIKNVDILFKVHKKKKKKKKKKNL